MMTLKPLDLGEAGITYVKSCLEKAGKGLSDQLLALPLAAGSAYTILPEGISLNRAKHFATGGIMSMDNAQNWLAHHVTTLASHHPNNMVIFQDAWGAKPTEPNIDKKRSLKFFDRSSVYYFVGGPSMTTEAVLEAMKDVASYLFIGGLFKSNTLSRDLTNRTLGDDAITHLAATVQEIYAGAYDQESIVVWRNSSAGLFH
jgi:hypothetical protein